jgi:hypothetical protein
MAFESGTSLPAMKPLMSAAIQSLKMAAIQNLRNIEDFRRASECQPDFVVSGLNP